MAKLNSDNVDTALDNWDNFAIDIYDTGSTSRDVLESLFEGLKGYDGDLKDVLKARHIDTATGEELDKISEIGDINRNLGESDDKYRARIKARLVSGNSSATFSDVVNFTASILDIDPTQLNVDNDYNNDPVAVVLGIPSSAFNNTQLTEQEVLEIMNTLVPAGHTTVLSVKNATFKLKEVDGVPQDQQVTAQDLEDDGYKGLSNTQSGGSYEGGKLFGLITTN